MTPRRIQIIGLFRSGTNYLKDLLQLNLDCTNIEIKDEDYWKHRIYPPDVNHFYFNHIDLVLYIYKDLLTWIESIAFRGGIFDSRAVEPYNLDPYEKASEQFMLGPKSFNLINLAKIWDLMFHNWVTRNPWFIYDPNFKNKMFIIPYEDLLLECNIKKLLQIAESLNFQTNNKEIVVPKLGTTYYSENQYDLDHIDNYLKKKTLFLTQEQKNIALSYISNQTIDTILRIKEWQLKF